MKSRDIVLLTLILLFPLWIGQPPLAHADQNQWVKYTGNPILAPTPGSWDQDSTTTPRVLFDGKMFRMWYVGAHSGVTAIGYATSLDGVSWTKYPEPVLTHGPPGSFDSAHLGLGSVVQMNDTLFLMWYQGGNHISFMNGAIGLATSYDGITWTKYQGNPVLRPTSIDQLILASPFVIRLNDTFNMWYTGKSEADSGSITRILYATSFDGINWMKWPHPVFSPSTNPEMWDSGAVYAASVIYDGTNFGLWYSGLNRSYLSPRIGFASAPDGATWTRRSTGLLLDLGGSGSWDSVGVEQPCVVIGYGYMLYYDGFSSVGTSIGLARAPQGFSIPEFPVPHAELLLLILIYAATCVLRRRGKKIR
jgi:predicted GH43/DUF377 family glycosyl hydrolase